MEKLAVFDGTGMIRCSIIQHLDTQDNWQADTSSIFIPLLDRSSVRKAIQKGKK